MAMQLMNRYEKNKYYDLMSDRIHVCILRSHIIDILVMWLNAT